MSSTKDFHHDTLMEQQAESHRHHQYDDHAPSAIADDERAWAMTSPVIPTETPTGAVMIAAPMPTTARLPISLDERCITAWTKVSRLFAERGYLSASEIVQDGYISETYAADFLHALADLGVVRPHPTRRCQTGDGRGRVRFETVWELAPASTTSTRTTPQTTSRTTTARRAA